MLLDGLTVSQAEIPGPSPFPGRPALGLQLPCHDPFPQRFEIKWHSDLYRVPSCPKFDGSVLKDVITRTRNGAVVGKCSEILAGISVQHRTAPGRDTWSRYESANSGAGISIVH